MATKLDEDFLRKFAGLEKHEAPKNEELNNLRREAGLPLVEVDGDASPEHIEKEEKLFVDCIMCCKDIVKMCNQRLKEQLTDEHTAQYQKIRKEATEYCAALQAHLDSYV